MQASQMQALLSQFHFSDASSNGYGQCSYHRLLDDKHQVHCSFVMSKAQVTPLKPITTPHLELTAALVSIKVSAMLQHELEYDKITEVFWADSQVVPGYIGNDARRFHIFVSNRVQQIRDHSSPDQWKYGKTKENPADEASHGLSAHDLVYNSWWLKGPAFLWESKMPSVVVECKDICLSSDDPEIKAVRVLTTEYCETKTVPTLLEHLEYFSNWHHVKKAIAACLKLKMQFEEHSVKKPPQADNIQTLRKT